MPKLPLPPLPQFGQVVQLFLDVKNDVFARITEPSNDDYDNDVNDNCDHNFGTFDDFGVKNGVRIFAIRTSATPYFVSFATPFLCLLPRHI